MRSTGSFRERVDDIGVSPASAPVHHHGNLIGSTMLLTDASGAAAAAATAYTAFGEPVWRDDAGVETISWPFPAYFQMRYAYAGEHGYEHGLLALFGVNEALPPLTLLHVGERWYDPALGRFMQRDPIGLAGGLNAYAYVNPGLFTNFVSIDATRFRFAA